MKLTVKRIALKQTYTIGKLYIDGVYFCDTLEDPNRDHNKDGDLNDIGDGKVYGDSDPVWNLQNDIELQSEVQTTPPLAKRAPLWRYFDPQGQYRKRHSRLYIGRQKYTGWKGNKFNILGGKTCEAAER